MTDKQEPLYKELYGRMRMEYLDSSKRLGDMRRRAEAAEQELERLRDKYEK